MNAASGDTAATAIAAAAAVSFAALAISLVYDGISGSAEC